MIKKTLFIVLSILGLQVQAAEQQTITYAGDPFKYKKEETVRDMRKIAVLAYGSLINDPAPSDGRPKLKISSQFASTGIKVPIALSRHSSKGKDNERVTAVIDNSIGTEKELYSATSWTQFLPNARNNLAGREGINLKDGKYDLKTSYYLKKLLPGKQKEADESFIPGTNNQWVRRSSDSAPDLRRAALKDAKAKEIADWADRKDYTAAIWASFPPTFATEQDVAKELVKQENGRRLLKNTQKYVRDLHVGVLANVPKTRFENAILSANPQDLRGSDLRKIANGQ